MISFQDFFRKFSLLKTASNIKVQQILSSLSLIDLGMLLRD